jgi:sec-independent protein translocase protein TatC
MTETAQTPPPETSDFLQHIIELRERLLKVILFISVITLALCYFANDLYHWIAIPLLHYLPAGTSLIATSITSPLFAPFKLAWIVALLISMPFILYQLWGFIAPGLYQHEKQWILPLILLSTFLFCLGLLFTYAIVLPMLFQFLIQTTPADIKVMPDMNDYLSFCLQLFFAFGITFEIPVLILLLVRTKIVTPETLKAQRPYVIVGAFILGMLLTPPDVLSQILLAIPMILLFEAGIYLSQFIMPKPSGKIP